MTTNAILLVNSAHGIYIPQLFAKECRKYIIDIDNHQEDIDTLLEGPDHEHYWDAWADVTDNVKLKDSDGNTFTLYQGDGDLWAIPEEEYEEIPEF